MKAKRKKAIMIYAMRMLICTVVCLFALSTMTVTARAEEVADTSAASETVETPSSEPSSGGGDSSPSSGGGDSSSSGSGGASGGGGSSSDSGSKSESTGSTSDSGSKPESAGSTSDSGSKPESTGSTSDSGSKSESTGSTSDSGSKSESAGSTTDSSSKPENTGSTSGTTTTEGTGSTSDSTKQDDKESVPTDTTNVENTESDTTDVENNSTDVENDSTDTEGEDSESDTNDTVSTDSASTDTTTDATAVAGVQSIQLAAAPKTRMLSNSASGEDNPAEPEVPIPEDQVEVEAYAIPAGSAYIHEISKERKYENSADNNGNAINEAMTEALTYLRDQAKDDQYGESFVATIVVQDGQYLGGLDLEKETGGSLFTELIQDILDLKQKGNSSNLTLRVVAHDAIVEENGKITEINANSEGNVKLEGGININIEGLNTILAGLYLSTRDLVSIKNAGSVEYYGTQQNDTINLRVSDIAGSTDGTIHIKVDSGDGNDTVTLEVRRRPNVSATVEVTQQQLDTLSQVPSLFSTDTTAEDIKPLLNSLRDILTKGINGSQGAPATVGVDVKLGAGEDVGSIKLIDASDVIMSLFQTNEQGEEFCQFGFAVDMGATNVTMDGGNGEDRLSVSGGRDFTFAQDFLKAAVDFVTDQMNGKTLPASSVTLQGGKGDDLITVDTTTPFAAWGDTEIHTDGEDGFDRLHLTGKLNDNLNEDQRISVDGTEITINALAQITVLGDLTDNALHLDFTKCFKILFQFIDSLTDALLNKRTVEVKDLNPGETLKPFTNYLVKPTEEIREFETEKEEGNPKIEKVTYKIINFDLDALKLSASDVLLSNLIFTDDLSTPISGKLGIDYLNAKGLNVLIFGEQIDVFGPIRAKNVLLSAYGEDEALAAFETTVVEDDLNADANVRIELGIYKANRDV